MEVHEKGRVTQRLLRMRVISLSAVFYGAKFHYAPSPTALSFIPRILLQRLMPLFGCLIIYIKGLPLQIHVRHGTTFPPTLNLTPHDWQSPFQLVAWGRGSPSP